MVQRSIRYSIARYVQLELAASSSSKLLVLYSLEICYVPFFFPSSMYYVVFILFHLLRSHSSSFDSSITRFAYNSDINTQRMTQNMLCTVRTMVCNISKHIFSIQKHDIYQNKLLCRGEKSLGPKYRYSFANIEFQTEKNAT